MDDKEIYLIKGRENPIRKVFSEKSKIYQKTHCVIITCSVPKSFYVIPTDAILTIVENGTPVNYTIKAGNYNVDSLLLILNTNLKPPTTQWTYTTSFPNERIEPQTGLYTFIVSGNGGLQPSYYTDSINLADGLGLKVSTTYLFVGNKLTSTQFLNFQTYDEIILTSNIIKLESGILKTIYNVGLAEYGTSIVSEFNSVVSDSRELNQGWYNTEIEFNLLDANGEKIDLHGNQWSFILVLYKINNFEKASIEYLKAMVKFQS